LYCSNYILTYSIVALTDSFTPFSKIVYNICEQHIPTSQFNQEEGRCMHIRVAHHLFSDTRFKRGFDYVNWGLVLNKPQHYPHVYEFLVKGTKEYHTSITVDDVGHLLSATCDCKGGRYCKHLAASIILLSQQKQQLYQMHPYLRIPEDFNDQVYDINKQFQMIIDTCKLALDHAKTQESTDVLFEAYEFYMEQMEWLIDHELNDHAIELLEWMMDEFVSYWTSANSDCIEMNFFYKQTQWIEALIDCKRIDPRRIMNDVMIWLQLYPEISDSVINEWLYLLSGYGYDDMFDEDLELLFEQAKQSVKDEKKLTEAHYFYANNKQKPFKLEDDEISYYPKIVRALVNQVMEVENYEVALEYILSQVQPRPKYEDIPWVSLWVFIKEKQEDKQGLKQALRWLFYCGEVNGYHQLKSMVDRRLWKSEVDIMLDEYQQGIYSDWTYRQLLVLEHDWERLKQHVQKHPWFISQLNKHLIDVDPDFVYTYLKQWIHLRYEEFHDWQSLQQWIVLFSSYFSEEQGWLLVNELKKHHQ
jgi:hemoglobin-like flavoprotein/flagellin-specific chaperone FliS